MHVDYLYIFIFIINASRNAKYVYGVMLMLMFRSVSKKNFFENRLNDDGVNFMNAFNNIT